MELKSKLKPLLACIRLMRTPQIGPIMLQKLIKVYGTPEKALDAVLNGDCGRIKNICSESAAEKEIELSTKLGARIISIFEVDYPKMLLQIYDPPPIITVLGNHSLLNMHSKVAIVGARNASTNGKRIAQGIAYSLAEAGFIVVSGLARGIDSAAHSVAFEKLPTIAVMASGSNVVYPRENIHLYNTIVESGGLVITELPFASLPSPKLFPQRNRIISGMSLGVVVVEASEKSGSLITANLALSQGREVLAVPGSILDQRYSGSNRLIKEGAALVESADDVVRELSLAYYFVTEHKARDNGLAKHSTNVESEKEIENVILNQLSTTPTDIEDLATCTGVGISALLASLVELELLKKVERLPGNKFALTPQD